MKKILLFFVAGLFAFSPAGANESCPIVRDTASYTHPTLGLTVVSGEVDLPPGSWAADQEDASGVLSQIHLDPLHPQGQARGRRFEIMLNDRQIKMGRNNLSELWSACNRYASEHGGMAPSSIADLGPQQNTYLIRLLEKSPWPEDQGKDVKGPFCFIIPGVRMAAEDKGASRTEEAAQPLILELRPYVDDGRHWVIMTNGRAERREIDQALLKEHGLAVNPLFPPGATGEGAPQNTHYRILALKKAKNSADVRFTLRDATTGASLKGLWDLAAAVPGEPQMLSAWAGARAAVWQQIAGRSDAPLLRRWLARLPELYGTKAVPGAGQVRSANTTDIFSVLGGRAAIRETLQMESLQAGKRDKQHDERNTPLAGIKGVEVKSHPFEELLAGAPPGGIPLADIVPADRFFAYFSKPAAVFPFLEEGAEFLFRSGSVLTKSSFEDDLKGRYFRRLGLTEKWGRRFIESGGMRDLAIVAPDLFFTDGTDITLVMRVTDPKHTLAMMKQLDIAALERDTVSERKLESGYSTYWYSRNDLLVVSSNRRELERVVELHRGGGQGGLGQSAEFRYMLQQLSPTKKTRAFIYLSDPFIRRLVGPEVKIGQLRRIEARSDMEAITAGALLYLLDGQPGVPDLPRLMELGYVPKTIDPGSYTLNKDLTVTSKSFGTLASPVTLLENPVGAVTNREAFAYARYVENYSRYWRQYFDPIAVRLDDGPDGALEVTSFILPLLDSTMYNGIREFLMNREAGQPLRTPVIDPEPVLTLSLNFPEKQWIAATEHWGDFFNRYTRLPPAIFDYFGPGLHLAVQDGDPIIVLGNGDILGALGGRLIARGGSDSFMTVIPMIVSMLTRPSRLFIELQDPGKVLEILRNATAKARETGRFDEMAVEFRQVEGTDRWIYSLNLARVVRIRLGIEVQKNYLVINNLPWSQSTTVKGTEEKELNGADLAVNIGAVKLQLPALFAAEGEQNQSAALQGMACLYPLLTTVCKTPDEAAARHFALFGYKPLHPPGGSWTWKSGRIASTNYGDPIHWKQPAYKAVAGDFGLFQGIERLAVNMQLEKEGLRATCRWIWKGGK